MSEQNNTQWAVVWETDEGPAVLGPYKDEHAAMDAAYEDWAGYQGGIAGGYDEGTREEFHKMFAQSSKIWVVPMDLDDPGAPTETQILGWRYVVGVGETTLGLTDWLRAEAGS